MINTQRRHIGRLLFSLLLIVGGLTSAFGQDPIYSQFYNAPLQLNPAFAGNTTTPLVAINYRNQWPNWGPRAYATYSVSYDQFFEAMNSGFGLNLNSDSAGDGILKTNRISGIYAYRVKFRDDFQAKIGLEASFTQNRLDWDKLIFLDQIDPTGFETGGGATIPTGEIRPGDLSKNAFDFSFGILAYSPSFYGGLTIKHLNGANTRFIEDPLNLF